MGRIFLYRGLHGFLHLTFWVFGSLVAALTLAISILALSLSTGPIPIDFAIPFIEEKLQTSGQNVSLSIDKADLEWDSGSRRLVIKANNIKLNQNNSKNDLVNIPDFELRYRLTALFKLKFIPSEIAIIEPKLRIYQKADGTFSLAKSIKSNSDNNYWLSSFSEGKEPGFFKSISNYIVKNMTIEVENINSGEIWSIPKADVVLLRQGSSLQMNISLDVKGAKVTAKATADLIKQNKIISGMGIKLDAVLENFEFDDLDKFWMATLAPKPRKWVIENLSKAHVSKANIIMTSHIDFSGAKTSFKMGHMGGKINFTGMDVNYFKDMPHVTNVNGVASYDEKQFIIDIKSGRLNDIKVSDGKIVIVGLDQKDQDIDIDLSLNGSLNTGLTVLSHKPLELFKRLDMKLGQLDGVAAVKLHFDFPLETSLTLDEVNVSANAKLNKVHAKNVLGSKLNCDLHKGNLSLTVDKSQLEVSGDAHIAGIPANIAWKQKFSDDVKDWRVQYSLAASVTSENLATFGYQGFFTGPIKINLMYEDKNKKLSKLTADVDFTAAELFLPGFLGVNKHGDAGKLQLRGIFRDNKLQEIQNFLITGDNLKVNAKVSYDHKRQIVTGFYAKDVKLGKTEVSINMKEGSDHCYYLDISGKKLDVKAILDYLKAKDSSSEQKFTQPTNISISVAEALFENNKTLSPLKLNCKLKDSEVEHLRLNAKLSGSGFLDVAVDRKNNQNLLKLKSNDAGETLSLFGITKSVHQGDIFIKARKKEGQSWAGKIKLMNFYVTEAPVVTQLISLSSPFGLFDVVTGKPITFNKFRALFIYNEGLIKIKDGRGGGKSIGFTVDGQINQSQHQVNIRGTILPYNAFNLFLTKIPLVGQLLGGKGGGLLGINYRVSGDSNSPSATVNPLSALAPGILRQIFSSSSPDEEFDEEGEEEDEFFSSDDNVVSLSSG